MLKNKDENIKDTLMHVLYVHTIHIVIHRLQHLDTHGAVVASEYGWVNGSTFHTVRDSI